MTRRHGIDQVSREDQRKYILELVISYGEKGGISTSGVMTSYKGKFGMAQFGKNKTDKKWEILEDLENLQKKGDIVFYKGNYFPSKKHKKDSESKT